MWVMRMDFPASDLPSSWWHWTENTCDSFKRGDKYEVAVTSPDPAVFSVSYQILSADDPIEISDKCQESPRKYLSQNNEQGIACSVYRVFIIQISSFPFMVRPIFMRVQTNIHSSYSATLWRRYHIMPSLSSVKWNTIMRDRMNQFCLCLISSASHFLWAQK